MISYHYTSLSDWENIKLQGLTPYPIGTPSPHSNMHSVIERLRGKNLITRALSGIWVWVDDPTGDNHVGNILFQGLTKKTRSVAKLRVDYQSLVDEMPVNENGDVLLLHHSGHVGGWVYHTHDDARILRGPISLDSINLMGVYTLNEAIAAAETEIPKAVRAAVDKI